ncbi:MAG: site-specific DNA-methyltransferase [Ardenticatenaceae bacterium]|nr:site-specific DNA-methyltransferase [Ardenticatenaceae bacterium]
MTNERPFRLEWVPAGSAQVNPDQYVEHPDEQLNRLRALIFGEKGVGWAGATLINERIQEKGWQPEECGHFFIDGHARDSLAQEFEADIPALIGQWTPAEEKQLIALINPLAMMAVVVPEKQLALLASAVSLAQDPGIIEALEALKEDAQQAIEANYVEPPAKYVDAEPLIDKAEQLKREWGVEFGQLWRLGDHLLLCGDSTNADDVQRLMWGERAVLFSTDPPYLIDFDGSNHPQHWNEASAEAYLDEETEVAVAGSGDEYEGWDDQGDDLYVNFMQQAVDHAITKSAPWYCWHASVHRHLVEEAWDNFGVLVHQEIVWVKNRPVLTRSFYMWQHEPCLFGWIKGHMPRHITKYGSTVWEFPTVADRDNIGHYTPKPPELFMIPMVQHTRIGDIVYEPFSGSGSQIIAAERLGRKCRAIEKVPGFVAVQLQRYLDATGVRPELVND